MTGNPSRVLVLGATGKSGSRVVAALRRRGVDPAAASRRGPVRFDWADRSSWQSALKGVAAVYAVDSQGPAAPNEVREFADLAAAAGVERLVLLGSRTLGEMGGDWLATERALRESAVGWTVLRPTWFAQNFTELDFIADPLRDGGELRLPTGDGREAFVDLEDVGEVAAVALTEDGHAERTYVLSGPQSFSFPDAVDRIARASGRGLRFVPVSEDAYRAELLAAGRPEAEADEIIAVLRHIRLERGWEPTEGVAQVLGRPPIDFSGYATRTFSTG